MQQQVRIRSPIEDLKKLAKEVDIFFTKFGSKITAYVHPMIVGTRSSVLHRPSQAGCSGIANTTTVFKRQQRSGFNSKAFKPAQKPRGFKLGFPRNWTSRDKNISLSCCPFVLEQGQKQKTWDKITSPPQKKTGKRPCRKGSSKTEKEVLKQERHSRTEKVHSKTGKEVL